MLGLVQSSGALEALEPSSTLRVALPFCGSMLPGLKTQHLAQGSFHDLLDNFLILEILRQRNWNNSKEKQVLTCNLGFGSEARAYCDHRLPVDAGPRTPVPNVLPQVAIRLGKGTPCLRKSVFELTCCFACYRAASNVWNSRTSGHRQDRHLGIRPFRLEFKGRLLEAETWPKKSRKLWKNDWKLGETKCYKFLQIHSMMSWSFVWMRKEHHVRRRLPSIHLKFQQLDLAAFQHPPASLTFAIHPECTVQKELWKTHGFYYARFAGTIFHCSQFAVFFWVIAANSMTMKNKKIKKRFRVALPNLTDLRKILSNVISATVGLCVVTTFSEDEAKANGCKRFDLHFSRPNRRYLVYMFFFISKLQVVVSVGQSLHRRCHLYRNPFYEKLSSTLTQWRGSLAMTDQRFGCFENACWSLWAALATGVFFADSRSVPQKHRLLHGPCAILLKVR